MTTPHKHQSEPVPNVVTWHAVFGNGFIESSEYTRQHAADYPAVTAILRIEIDHNTWPAPPTLVSATLETP